MANRNDRPKAKPKHGVCGKGSLERICAKYRLFERAVDASSCAITIADAADPEMPLIYVNKAFEEITGYGCAECLGKNCRFLQADDRDQEALQTIHKALQEHRPCTAVLRNYRKNGELFWNELRMAPVFDEKKRLIHYIGIQTNITDRVRAEGEVARYREHLENLVRERTQKLEEKNTALKEVLDQIQTEKEAIRDQVVRNVERLIFPLLRKYAKKADASARPLWRVLEKNLEEITAPFGAAITRKFYKLTPKEIDIANMIRAGLSTKEISETMHVSPATVENQRNSIRKKLGISKKDINLTSYLQNLPQ